MHKPLLKMKEKILIVEDEFIVANNLRLILTKAGYEVCGIAASVAEAKKIVDKTKPSWVLLDIFLQDESQGTDLADYLSVKGIAFIYISANTNQSILEKAKATQPYGFLVKPYRERDLLLMLDIAREKHLNNLHFRQQQELLLQKQLELINYMSLGIDEKWNRIPSVFQSLVSFDMMRIAIINKRGKVAKDVTFTRSGFNEYQTLKQSDLADLLGLSGQEISGFSIPDAAEEAQKIYCNAEFDRLRRSDPYEKKLSAKYRLECKLLFSFELQYNDYAFFSFYSRKTDTYTLVQMNFLVKAQEQLSQLMNSLLQSSPEKPLLKTMSLSEEKIRRETERKSAPNFEGIIGKSPLMLDVLDKVSLVAPTQSSVLILGDSGTGKERVAQCIHSLSPRKSKPIITVNCAALPKDLIESELFGHEKGAFTGALEKRLGKFALADGGSIFLDEVGELPLDAQVKLLRVLQEREIEHVGGSRSFKIDVRVIAATNRKLEKEVAEGRFRLDLYYRLNVFPIELPSLKERKMDIPLLADYFIEKHCQQMHREPPVLSQSALKQMEGHHWPGNVRELEHLLERTLLLNPGPIINQITLPVTPAILSKMTSSDYKLKTLEEMEAEHIVSVLKSCNGKIGGSGGAAEVLGVPPSTLNSKIKKLGIRKASYF
jgi:DNA-binding NtrC family response regulator